MTAESYIRDLDAKGDRELALLAKAARRPLATAIQRADMMAEAPAASPVLSDRGNRGGRGATPDKGLQRHETAVPDRGSRGTDTGDKHAVRPHFELLEAPADGQRPGVYWLDVMRDAHGEVTGQAAPAWICSPLRVVAMTRDAQGSAWGRLLVFPDRDGTLHRWTMPMRMLAGNGEELRGELLAEGLTITSSGRDRARLVDYIGQARPDVNARCVTRTGWHGDVFVLPRETFGDTDTEPVLYQAATLDGVTLGQGGTIDGWIEHVAKPCAGNARLVLAVSMGFAGPCLDLLRMDGGGFHLRGGSSTGKTTALCVAASLFGSPDYVRTWRHTDNGLEGVAGMHSGLLLVLDEIGELAPKIAGHTAYMLANGQGKGRAARDGSPRSLTTWRLLFLSSGEVALADLVTQAGGKVRAGQEVRIIDLPADAGAGRGLFDVLPEGMTAGAFADALKASSAKHHGHALPAFLRVLVTEPAKYREALAKMRDTIAGELADDSVDGQVRRVAQRFALVAAAGELATAFKLTGWATGEAQRAAAACFRAWMAGRGTPGASEPAAMLEQVRAFLSANGEARFTPWHGNSGDRVTINRAGFRKDGPDGPTYYVEREAFRREVCSGFDHGAVAKVLAGTGALELGSKGESTRPERLPDSRTTRVYVITPAVWSDV